MGKIGNFAHLKFSAREIADISSISFLSLNNLYDSARKTKPTEGLKKSRKLLTLTRTVNDVHQPFSGCYPTVKPQIRIAQVFLFVD
jgi:hypothetical protein